MTHYIDTELSKNRGQLQGVSVTLPVTSMMIKLEKTIKRCSDETNPHLYDAEMVERAEKLMRLVDTMESLCIQDPCVDTTDGATITLSGHQLELLMQ